MLLFLILSMIILPREAITKALCSCPSTQQCRPRCLNATIGGSNHRVQRREADTDDVEEIIDERKCNNDNLKDVMLQNMVGQTAKEAKTKIMRASEALLGGHFNVICANGDFSYITTTRLYCLQALGDINCYAFLTEFIRPTP